MNTYTSALLQESHSSIAELTIDTTEIGDALKLDVDQIDKVLYKTSSHYRNWSNHNSMKYLRQQWCDYTFYVLQNAQRLGIDFSSPHNLLKTVVGRVAEWIREEVSPLSARGYLALGITRIADASLLLSGFHELGKARRLESVGNHLFAVDSSSLVHVTLNDIRFNSRYAAQEVISAYLKFTTVTISGCSTSWENAF